MTTDVLRLKRGLLRLNRASVADLAAFADVGIPVVEEFLMEHRVLFSMVDPDVDVSRRVWILTPQGRRRLIDELASISPVDYPMTVSEKRLEDAQRIVSACVSVVDDIVSLEVDAPSGDFREVHDVVLARVEALSATVESVVVDFHEAVSGLLEGYRSSLASHGSGSPIPQALQGVSEESRPGVFVSPCSPPTGYAAEILVVIDEELHEIGEAVARLLANQTPETLREVAFEVGDLYETVRRAVSSGTLPHVECPVGPAFDAEPMVALLAALSLAGQRVCKALRFGLPEVQPGQPHDNAMRAAIALHRVREAVAGTVVSVAEIEVGMARKSRQLDRFLQTTP
jgi:hypothetical protein